MFRHYVMSMQDRGCGPRGPWSGRGEGHEAHFGPPRGFGGERGFGRHGFGPGGGRERLFDNGVMRLVILQQLADEPSYGYQLIKTLEERMAGGYRPSPGVIYPTLTMLEEQGLTVAVANEAGKKVYSVTDEGRAYLSENKERLAQIQSLMKEAGRGFKRGRAPQIMEAFMKLRAAVGAKANRDTMTAEQVKKIADAIAQAAKTIDEL